MPRVTITADGRYQIDTQESKPDAVTLANGDSDHRHVALPVVQNTEQTNKEGMLKMSGEEKQKVMCEWKNDELHGHYQTECGNGFILSNDESLAETGFKFCVYCGGQIFQVKQDD